MILYGPLWCLMAVAGHSANSSLVLVPTANLNLFALWLNVSKQVPAYGAVKTKRTPDLLISDQWALEFKLVRPFGDNGKEAENWSVNLLHPYEGSVSLIGDCLKLSKLAGPEHKAVIVIGYEHTPPRISLIPLLDSFEIVARMIMQISLGERIQITRPGLCHPVHQQLSVVAWEVLNRNT